MRFKRWFLRYERCFMSAASAFSGEEDDQSDEGPVEQAPSYDSAQQAAAPRPTTAMRS